MNALAIKNMKIKAVAKYVPRIFILIVCVLMLGFLGCKGKTINPTDPEIETPEPSPSPTSPETPGGDQTPTSDAKSCDNYADSPDDPNLRFLEIDDEPLVVTLECTGDIDWYKIRISKLPVKLQVELTDIPRKSDFDLVVYDSHLIELQGGRSAQSGNGNEEVSFVADDSLFYLQVYSYSGRGEALLSITEDLDEEEGEEEEENEPEEEPEEEIEQLSYEEVLDTQFPLYPRGTAFGLLENSVETLVVKSISCQLSEREVSGKLSIGNYAHVKRDLLQATDYIDGWALVVFNGSKQVLERLTITIRITIFAPELDLKVKVPPYMEVQGNDYLTSEIGNEVYYISQFYGDFLGNSQDDIQISSGVVGDLGDLFANNIFTQQVEIEWRLEDLDGTRCSGKASGKPITDFNLEMLRFLSSL